jgi:exosortase/archaeosortase family protein
MTQNPAPPRPARFVIALFVYLVAGVGLLAWEPVERGIVRPWTRWNASGAAVLATLLGVETSAADTAVRSGSTQLDIQNGCNGVHALLILACSMLAFPATWRRRLIGLLVGTVTVLGCNLVRLVTLIFVARYFSAHLELVHIYVWQPLIILLAFALFSIWAGRFAADRARPAIGDAARA